MPAAGKLYVNGIYTGRTTPDTLQIPRPGTYRLGVGGADDRYYQKEITVGGGMQSARAPG